MAHLARSEATALVSRKCSIVLCEAMARFFPHNIAGVLQSTLRGTLAVVRCPLAVARQHVMCRTCTNNNE